MAFNSVLTSDTTNLILKRLHTVEENTDWSQSKDSHDAHNFPDNGFSIMPDQGNLLYILCRSMRATGVVDFATSLGFSALYFAQAMKDNGGGLVIGSELVPEKAQVAKKKLQEAGLDKYVDLRVGDARLTLKDLGGPVDVALIDGWPAPKGPSLSFEILQVIAPQLRVGGLLINDNAEKDYLEFVNNPKNDFVSMKLPIKGQTEVSLKIF